MTEAISNTEADPSVGTSYTPDLAQWTSSYSKLLTNLLKGARFESLEEAQQCKSYILNTTSEDILHKMLPNVAEKNKCVYSF